MELKTEVKPAPERRGWQRRLTDSLRSLPVNDQVAVELDPPTATALVAYAHYHKWQVRQQRSEGGLVLVWRVG